MIRSLKDLIDVETNTGSREYSWRKLPSQTSSANVWYDLAIAPGTPGPKYWFDATPLVAKQVSQSADGGFFHGANVSPQTKYLRGLTFYQAGSSSGSYLYQALLCDYLLYYPSVDESTTDPQIMDNTVTLPRYTDGNGVQVVAVSLASRTGGQTFSFTYTNSDGVAGRVSKTARLNAYTQVGTIATADIAQANQMAPFIGLQDGDHGVRSIDSVTMNGADTGLFALILVMPLTKMLQGLTTQFSGLWMQLHEKDPLLESNEIPIIQDDAFIGLLSCPMGNGHNLVHAYGNLKVIID